MFKTFLQKAEEWAINLSALLFLGMVITVIVCLVTYPAFSITFIVAIILTTVSCVHWGYAPVDFPGTAIVPYLGLATGLYLTSFAVLHYFHWKGGIAFEVEWLALGVTATIASLVTFVVCLTINHPRR